MRLPIVCTLLGLSLGACAVEPGDPLIKVHYGEAPPPSFAELNYAVDFGRRCSPPDGAGRHFSSFVWLRANRADGGYDPLRAATEHCGSIATVRAD
tara:strand:+ start:569 stop:856 length:288 start_codon:yes stop_codon:yes gene_type:complete